MSTSAEYEFGYISRKERVKLAVAKFSCLVLATYALYSIIFLQLDTSSKLHQAAGVLAALGFYINLFRVKSEVVEIFEPPYHFHGHGLGILCFCFMAAGFYYEFMRG